MKKPTSVLVAEDNIRNRRVAKRCLEKLGCRVSVVANGLECLNLLDQIPFDIIFMDLQMPEMKGYEATKAIRNHSDENKASTPIIAMTAHALLRDKEKYLAEGMNGYISKPLDPDDFEEVLKKWVKIPA